MDGEEEFDEAAFAAWLAADPARQPVFEAMWRRTMGSGMDAALGAYERRGTGRRTALAGVVALLLAVGGGYKAMPLIQLQLAEPQLYQVAEGEIRAVSLADGTQLTLAGGAQVKVRYTRYERQIELSRGTIFANVAHDDRRPLRVDAGDARIEVLGTSFEVSAKPMQIRVEVASGIVQFGRKLWFDQPIDLTVNQAAILNGAGVTRIADVSPDNIARWRNEWAEYKGAPLRQVIADLQDLLPMPIEIADAQLSDHPVSGRIKLTDPMGQIENLSITHSFQVHRKDDALIISEN